MDYAAYIFDLDGTLLDTLPDLVQLTNMVLENRSWPKRTQDEILSFVGNGGRVLLERAAPVETPAHELDDAFAEWRDLYPTYGHALTKPYDGIPEMLDQLKRSGAKLGVLSNKFDAAVRTVIAEHFPGVFDLARGECEEIPRKPDPTGLLHMLKQLGVTPAQVAFVGDSQTDIETARAAGTACIAVTWGYQQPSDADLIVNHPSQIIYNGSTSDRKDRS